MRFLSHFGAAILLIFGICVAVFSVPVAFGWGHQILSLAATLVALIGYAGVLAGYFLLRSSDWEPVASVCVKGLLLLGSALLLPGLTAIVIRASGDYYPTAYFITTGALSVIAYLWFRRYSAVA